MLYSRYFSRLVLVSTFYVGMSIALISSFVARADAVEVPKKGTQWLFGGLVLSPSLMIDDSGPERGVPDISIANGFALRLGFQHAIGETFYMRAEGQIGATYFRPHTAHPDGVFLFDETAFSWQLSLGGQYIPLGSEGGPALGLSLNMYRASLTGGALQTLAPDFRLGWYFWKEKNFVLLEFSYAFPLLEGLNPPVSFADDDARVPQTWSFHQFGIAMTTNF